MEQNQNSEEFVKELIKVLQTNTDLKIDILNIPSEKEKIITTTYTDLKPLLNILIGKIKIEENIDLEKEAEENSEQDISEKDIELVANQAGVSRTKAFEALQKQNGDVVNAIMDLSLV